LLHRDRAPESPLFGEEDLPAFYAIGLRLFGLELRQLPNQPKSRFICWNLPENRGLAVNAPRSLE
jgi:hypothetical protein